MQVQLKWIKIIKIEITVNFNCFKIETFFKLFESLKKKKKSYNYWSLFIGI